MNPLDALYPLLLAAADLAVGAVLYRSRSTLLGLAILAVGVLVVYGIVCRAVHRVTTAPESATPGARR